MKFRKKPVIIEAVQYNGQLDGYEEVCIFMGEKNNLKVDDGVIYISTLEGIMKAQKNDWIIRGINGEFYPCKPDIFEKTYEKAD